MDSPNLLPKFAHLTINQNKNGWGPSDIPIEFKNMPYQPFSKDTRLGKIADWSGNVYQDMKSKNRYTSQFGGGGQYAYYHDDDDTSFQTAGAVKPKTAPYLKNRQRIMIQRKQRGGMPYNPRQQTTWQQQQPVQQQKGMRQNIPSWRKINMRQHDNRTKTVRVIREPSIQIQDHWPTIDEIDLNRLGTLSLPKIQDSFDIVDFGELGYFDPSLDRINTKDEIPLTSGNSTLFYLPVTSDSVITQLIKNKIGNVFMSTQVASFLMCSPRSIYSWDIIAYCDDSILLDFRENYEDLNIELHTMNENAQEPPPENQVKSLILEGALCTHQFRKRVLQSDPKAQKFMFPSGIPDLNDESSEDDKKQTQSFGFRYRLFDIGNGNKVVIRCEVDAAVAGKDESDRKFACVYALTECPVKASGAVDWRSKLDTRAGAVLASELRNNSFKLARFTTRAILSGAEFIKLGFISRVNPKDQSKHSILGVQQYTTSEFAQQMGYNLDNAWGILRCIIDHLKRMPSGCYLIQKDANKPMLRFHSLPDQGPEEDDISNMDEEQLRTFKEERNKEADERLKRINEALGSNKLGIAHPPAL